MGPQNSSKSSRQLYSGGSYAPSDRANKAVTTATKGLNKSSQVVGEDGNQVGKTPTQETKPKNPAGGPPPSEKQQAAAHHTNVDADYSLAQEKA